MASESPSFRVFLSFQVQLYDFDGEIACQERRLYGNRRLIAKTIKVSWEFQMSPVELAPLGNPC